MTESAQGYIVCNPVVSDEFNGNAAILKSAGNFEKSLEAEVVRLVILTKQRECKVSDWDTTGY